ncbi:hypothetical protein ACFLSW_02025 [Candidatus Bipolaricaulota bacterium]
MDSAVHSDHNNHLASHAAATIYLVSRSVDRLSEGRRLAATVVSSNESEDSKTLRGIHPDVLELTPPEGKERIGIGQVRDIIRLAQFAPVQSPCKVCLIPNAEGLTVEAANALLKILEEPPRGLRFILLAEHPSDLLPTIVSRSRLIRIPIASHEQIAARLLAAGYTKEHAPWIARLALRDGELDQLIASPVDIAQLLAETAARLSRSDVSELIGDCLGDGPIARKLGMLQLLNRMAARDAELLTVGVRVLGAQTRDSLSRFFHELLVTTFNLVRSAHNAHSLTDVITRQIREAFGVRNLHEFCFALDDAQRSLSVYGPVEGILLSLFLVCEGEKHDG